MTEPREGTAGAADFIETAVRAARAAGAIIARDFGSPTAVRFKGRTNPVTETDLRAEETILSAIRARHPSHDILTEEAQQAAKGSPYLWIVDPMDGTTNFTHGYPFVCVSVALYREGEPLAGVVYDPLRDELFLAGRGTGATANGAPIRVSLVDSFEGSLLCTGFPYRLREEPRDNFRNFEGLSLRAQGVRRDGSAALDLCYVAAGRLDGFWERELKPWDTAAAVLILREAGGRVTDYAGGEFSPFMAEIVATNGRIHDEMLAVLSPGLQ
ncbi:MAG: inositol monophosphatase family protein [bacterium]|nr:inositol monophosphatase family protein [bacterium]